MRLSKIKNTIKTKQNAQNKLYSTVRTSNFKERNIYLINIYV